MRSLLHLLVERTEIFVGLTVLVNFLFFGLRVAALPGI